jgi:hypothetical protein
VAQSAVAEPTFRVSTDFSRCGVRLYARGGTEIDGFGSEPVRVWRR